jgi:hypothetical protein
VVGNVLQHLRAHHLVEGAVLERESLGVGGREFARADRLVGPALEGHEILRHLQVVPIDVRAD